MSAETEFESLSRCVVPEFERRRVEGGLALKSALFLASKESGKRGKSDGYHREWASKAAIN